MRVPAVRVNSVACQSIPRPNGAGAVGCGAGWTQPVDGPAVCPRCGRTLVVTGSFAVAALPRAPGRR